MLQVLLVLRVQEDPLDLQVHRVLQVRSAQLDLQDRPDSLGLLDRSDPLDLQGRSDPLGLLDPLGLQGLPDLQAQPVPLV